MLIALILQGKFTSEGKPDSHFTSKRMVIVDLDKKSEARDIQKFLSKEDNQEHWGLIAKDLGWWLIIEAYELIEPNQDLHEDKYDVAFYLTKEQFEKLLENFK